MQSLMNTKKSASPQETRQFIQRQDWAKRADEGRDICSYLRQRGYSIRKVVRSLAWKISKGNSDYRLCWIPTPVEEWTLLPNDDSPVRNHLMLYIEQALAKRGAGR
jgi:hypothetical protein